MTRQKSYSIDLSDSEWAILEPFLSPPYGGKGCPPGIPRREIATAIFSVLRTGCQWRDLPEGVPHWNTVYGSFAKWRDDGTWERANAALRRRLRVSLGREPEPSAAIGDSQSVKTTERGRAGLRRR